MSPAKAPITGVPAVSTPHSQCATVPPGRVVYRALSGPRERTAEP